MENPIIISDKSESILSKIKEIDHESNVLLTNSIYEMIEKIPESIKKNFDIDIIAHTGKMEINFGENILTKGACEINIKMKNLAR